MQKPSPDQLDVLQKDNYGITRAGNHCPRQQQ